MSPDAQFKMFSTGHVPRGRPLCLQVGAFTGIGVTKQQTPEFSLESTAAQEKVQVPFVGLK